MTEERTSYGKLLALHAEASQQYMDYIGCLETSIRLAEDKADEAVAAELRAKQELLISDTACNQMDDEKHRLAVKIDDLQCALDGANADAKHFAAAYRATAKYVRTVTTPEELAALPEYTIAVPHDPGKCARQKLCSNWMAFLLEDVGNEGMSLPADVVWAPEEEA